eukprot:14187256-Alexandrium_andersonii.AAC.1
MNLASARLSLYLAEHVLGFLEPRDVRAVARKYEGGREVATFVLIRCADVLAVRQPDSTEECALCGNVCMPEQHLGGPEPTGRAVPAVVAEVEVYPEVQYIPRNRRDMLASRLQKRGVFLCYDCHDVLRTGQVPVFDECQDALHWSIGV